MRRTMSAVVLSLAVLFPSVSNAQITEEPVLMNGLYFYPTREFRIFDANVMTQVASSQRAPIYVDSTLAPNTVVYLAVGGKTMRAYRIGEPGAAPVTAAAAAVAPAPVLLPAPAGSEDRTVGTSGSTVPAIVGTGSNVVAPRPAADARASSSRRETVPLTTLQPQGNQGIWIEYDGARYFAGGAAAVFSADRFTRIGEYQGFPVYRAADDSNKDRIWVTSAIDGPVAPFVRR